MRIFFSKSEINRMHAECVMIDVGSSRVWEPRFSGSFHRRSVALPLVRQPDTADNDIDHDDDDDVPRTTTAHAATAEIQRLKDSLLAIDQRY